MEDVFVKAGMDDRSKQKILKYLTGGLAVGGGVGLGVALLNRLRDLQGEVGEDTTQDDNTLYLDLPGKKQATITGGTAVTAGFLATLGSAALVRKLYKEIKRKELQKRLDQAQVGYTKAVEDEADVAQKSASRGTSMHTGEMATSIPVALLLLTGLASGALTYKGLNKYFPPIKNTKDIGPKRVVIRGGGKGKEEEPDPEKLASEDDGLEFQVKLAMASGGPNDLKDMVYAMAQGRGYEFRHTVRSSDLDTALDLVKGASEVETPLEDVEVAVAVCVKDAYLKPIARALAAAEYNEMAPHFVKAAASLPPGARDALADVGGLLGVAYRNAFWEDRDLEKCAALMPLLQSILEGGPEGGGPDREDLEQTPLLSESAAQHSPEDPNSEKEDLADAPNEADVAPKDDIDMVFG